MISEQILVEFIYKTFLAGFCLSFLPVAMVSVLEAVIHTFKRFIS